MLNWSYSSLKTFEQCPALYKGKYIDRVHDPQSEAARWGTRVHHDLEMAIKENKPLPAATKPYEWALQLGQQATAIGAVVKCEFKMALTRDLKPTGFKDNNAWLRGVADLFVTGVKTISLWDYKTGKRRHGNTQLEIMSAMAFQYEPQVERVEARFLWMQDRKSTGVSLNRENLPAIWEDLLQRAHRMERAHETGVFMKHTGWWCRFCPIKTCEFNEANK